jgi:hypothetical protein
MQQPARAPQKLSQIMAVSLEVSHHLPLVSFSIFINIFFIDASALGSTLSNGGIKVDESAVAINGKRA